MEFATVAAETGGGASQSIPWRSFEHLREGISWSDPILAAYSEPIRAHLSYQQVEREISVAAASDGFFPKFTQGLEAGQDFSSSWLGGHGGTEVILSRRLAEMLFDDPTNALDRSVVLNGQTFRVIGVAPRRFSGLWSPTEAWVTPDKIAALEFGAFKAESHLAGEQHSPFHDNPEVWQKLPFFYVLAGSPRLSHDHLNQRLGLLVRSPENLPDHLHVSDGLSKDPVWDAKVRNWARLTFLLSTALIFAAALDYCGLLLAQAPRYLEEVRLKRVLGATVLRIVFESMCGPIITVLAGFFVAAFGVLTALWALRKGGNLFLPPGVVSWRVALSTLGIGLAFACILAVMVALVPSFRLLRDSGVPRMGYTSTPSRKASLALYGIVASQIAFCIVTCLISVMIINAVRSISREELGFDAAQLTAIEVGPASKGAPIQFSTAGTGDFPLATFTRLVIEGSRERTPGVKYMSAASCAPLAQPMKTIMVQSMDRDLPPQSVHFCGVSQGFFQSIGNPIIAGRSFSSGSFMGDVSEVVINRKLADSLWPGENPLHRSIRIEEPAWDLRFIGEVVGVAQDMRFSGLTSTPDATVFLPLRGNVFTLSFPLYFLAKGTESPHFMEGFTRQQAAASMPSLGGSTSYRVDERLHESLMEQKVRVWFSAGGAAIVAILAYLGLYGVLVHSVNSKRRELALRACFGASADNLRKITIKKALQCSGCAIAISLLAWRPMKILAASAWLGKVELSWQHALAVALLCVAAAVAISLFPASAASRVSPAELLREQ